MDNQVPANMGHNRDALILEWDKARKELTPLKDKESKLRKEIIDMEFSGAKTGTNKVELGKGYALKAVIKLNYSITKNEAVEPPDYSHIPAILAQLPPDIANSIIRWKPEFSESVYKRLTESEKQIVNQFLLITNGSSTLELVEPKQKAIV